MSLLNCFCREDGPTGIDERTVKRLACNVNAIAVHIPRISRILIVQILECRLVG